MSTLQTTVFKDDKALERGLGILRQCARTRRIAHPLGAYGVYKLSSLVAHNPHKDIIRFTSPILTDTGLRGFVQAARDTGWTPCYIINVRLK